ncbi:hypothetical protein PENSPDRAFT_653749 [Peniophora sp. CONT]|nr:hypothetical protein PENSPDRAFT_653749 [Peniophora sp. CONT]
MTVGQPNTPSSACVGDQHAHSAHCCDSRASSTPGVILPYPPQSFAGVHWPYGRPPTDPHSGHHFPPGAVPYSLPYGTQGFVYAYPPPPLPFGYPLYPSLPQQPAPRKRTQVKSACTNCAAACKKCEEARPCDRCIRYNIADTCVTAVRKERKKGVKRGPYKKKEKGATEPKETEPGSAAPVQSGSPAPVSNGEVHSPPKYSPPPTFVPGLPPPRYFPPPPEGHPFPYWYPPPPPHHIPPPLGDGHDGRPPTQAPPPPYPCYGPPLHAAYPPYPLYHPLPYPPPPGSVPSRTSPVPSASSGSVACARPLSSSAGHDTEGKHVYAREADSPGAPKRKIIVWDERTEPQPAAKRCRYTDDSMAI